MKYFKPGLWTLVTVGLVVVFNTKFGSLPPLGKFFDPVHGFWKNAEGRNLPEKKQMVMDGLRSEVTVVYDDQRVPHIFAGNDDDLYFAQGYITASDRLWQMDFQTRFAAGRLSEVIGPKALELDRYQRRMGMAYGAEKMIQEVSKHPEVKRLLEAYARGVNAYIRNLAPADDPVEFKLLDYRPEEWKILNSALLLKLMSATLSSGSDEFYMSNILRKFGPEVTRNLFPDYPFREDPIIPAGTDWKFKPLQLPKVPEYLTTARAATTIATRQKEEGIGSNNWAVSGAKTASGYPILANDPHLDLTLPAIWYQVQLSAPKVNVTGVSIPGSPCVIIGFNQQVAWGVTNVGSDVLDWYRVEFSDARRTHYRFEGELRQVSQRIEHIAVRGQETVNDTVLYTHHGPVVYLDKKPAFSKTANVPVGHALRWVAHEPSADVWAFYLLNRARNYSDYRRAISWFAAPAQNFAFADVDNDIAITPNGKFPLRWPGQGKFLLDGTRADNDWQGWVPVAQNPTVKNPPRGFVSSANQSPTDRSYPYYLAWEFAPYERGHRINQRLTAMTQATPDSMRVLQGDTYSILAENILPTLLQGLRTTALDDTQKQAAAILGRWNRRFDAGEIGASLFDVMQKRLAAAIWDEFSDAALPMRYPSRDRTVELLLNEPNSPWFDVRATPQHETRDELIQRSFIETVDSLQRGFGPIGERWQWGKVKGSHVPHLAAIPGFGSPKLDIGGAKFTVNALSEKNGPSWRMVVALGKPTRGYGIFPGGESGNPGSFYYDNMIGTWANGQLHELLLLNNAGEANSRIKSRLTLQKK